MYFRYEEPKTKFNPQKSRQYVNYYDDVENKKK